jgi:hypothetical protein
LCGTGAITRAGHYERKLQTKAGEVKRVMRHFYLRALIEESMGAQADWNAVDSLMQKALAAAEKVARYKHAQLSAVRLAGSIDGKMEDVSMDELLVTNRARLAYRGVSRVFVTVGAFSLARPGRKSRPGLPVTVTGPNRIAKAESFAPSCHPPSGPPMLLPARQSMNVHPETKHGGDRKSESRSQNANLKSFVADTAKKTGKHHATVARDVKRGKDIPDVAAPTEHFQARRIDPMGIFDDHQRRSLSS